MLPQRHRLRRRSDVLRVRRLGKAWRHPLAVLLVVRSQTRATGEHELSTAPPTRFAFTAGRPVGPAVARHRAKRLLREAVHERLGEIEPGWDCLFIVREPTPGADYTDIQKAVSNLLRRAGLLEPVTG
jgi:ribonuclease P protein component